MSTMSGEQLAYLSPAQMAARLGVSVETMRRILREGTIPQFRISKGKGKNASIFVKASDFEAWLAAQEQRGKEQTP